jgi:hypothetical protein
MKQSFCFKNPVHQITVSEYLQGGEIPFSGELKKRNSKHF